MVAAVLLTTPVYSQSIQIDGSTATAITALPGGGLGVTIAAPNSRGVSHNSYTQFSVGAEGAVLGNEGRGASVIVNEVTSAARTQLRGSLSVAGDRADVVIVNPNGIAVNGARVSNVRGFALIVGQRRVDASSGALRFAVGSGQIEVTGAGLLGDAQRIDLAAGGIRVSGPLGSDAAVPVVTIGMHAGQGDLELQPDVLSVNGPDYLVLSDRGTVAANGLALVVSDSALLSGGRILMTADDRGAGVAMSGKALAATGEFHLTADGRVTMTDVVVTARTALRVTAGQGVTVAGGTLAAETANLSVNGGAGEVSLMGTSLTAGGAMQITAALAVDATGTSIGSGADMAVTAGRFALRSTGSRAAVIESFGGNLSLQTTGDIAVEGAVLSGGTGLSVGGGGDFRLLTTAIDRIAVLTTLAGALTLTLDGDVSNQSGRVLSAGALTIRSGGQVINGAIVSAETNLLTFGQGIGQLRAAGALSIFAAGKADTTGGIIDGKSVVIQAASLRADRQMFGTIGRARSCFLVFCRDRLIGGLTFGGGSISAKDDLQLTIGAGGADLVGGALSGGRVILAGPRFDLSPLTYRTAYAGSAGLRGFFGGKRLRYLLGYEAASITTVAQGLVLTAGSAAHFGSVDLSPIGLTLGVTGITLTDPIAAIALANRPSLGIFAPVLD